MWTTTRGDTSGHGTTTADGLPEAGAPVQTCEPSASYRGPRIDLNVQSAPGDPTKPMRSVADVRRLLNAGADKVSFNSAAVADPALIRAASERYGAQCIVVAIDARRRPDSSGWDVFTHGGRRNTGLDAVDWARRMAAEGAGEILLTSMDRDGTRAGFDLALTRAVADAVDVPVIASGGVGGPQHMADGLEAGADAALAASIFHFGEFSIAEVKERLAAAGVAVR